MEKSVVQSLFRSFSPGKNDFKTATNKSNNKVLESLFFWAISSGQNQHCYCCYSGHHHSFIKTLHLQAPKEIGPQSTSANHFNLITHRGLSMNGAQARPFKSQSSIKFSFNTRVHSQTKRPTNPASKLSVCDHHHKSGPS